MNPPQPELLTLWSIQDPPVVEILERDGVFWADGRKLSEGTWLRKHYAWMRQQFKHRIPGAKGRALTWAWHSPKPDLRAWSWRAEKGRQLYRIEFQIPANKVLLSDYEMWHLPLNNGYIPLDKADAEAFEAEEDAYLAELRSAGIKRAWQETQDHFWDRIVASWDRVFDLELMAKLQEDPWFGGSEPRPQMIQAVLEEIRLDWVTKITPYKGRSVE